MLLPESLLCFFALPINIPFFITRAPDDAADAAFTLLSLRLFLLQCCQRRVIGGDMAQRSSARCHAGYADAMRHRASRACVIMTLYADVDISLLESPTLRCFVFITTLFAMPRYAAMLSFLPRLFAIAAAITQRHADAATPTIFRCRRLPRLIPSPACRCHAMPVAAIFRH